MRLSPEKGFFFFNAMKARKPIFMGIAEVKLIDVEPRYATRVEVFWIDADDKKEALAILNKTLVKEWGKRITWHRVAHVLEKQEWGTAPFRLVG